MNAKVRLTNALVVAGLVLASNPVFAGNRGSSGGGHQVSNHQFQRSVGNSAGQFQAQKFNVGSNSSALKTFSGQTQMHNYQNLNGLKLQNGPKYGLGPRVTDNKVFVKPVDLGLGNGKGPVKPIDLGLGKGKGNGPIIPINPILGNVGNGNGKGPMIPLDPGIGNGKGKGPIFDPKIPIDPGIGNGKGPKFPIDPGFGKGPKIPICPPYPYPTNPPLGCHVCPSWFNHWCWFPGYFYGGCYGYTNGLCLPTVVTQQVVVEIPVEHVTQGALPQIVPGTTVRMNVTDLGDKQGVVLLEVGSIALQVTVEKWESGQVTMTIPMVALKSPTLARLVVMRGDGQVTRTVDCELVPVQVEKL